MYEQDGKTDYSLSPGGAVTMKTAINTFIFFISLCGFATAAYSEQGNTYQADAISAGKLAEAEQGLLAVLEKDPNDPYALLNLAYVYQKSGDAAKAQQVYQRILKLKENPYAELATGKPEPVKSIARRGIAQAEAE